MPDASGGIFSGLYWVFRGKTPMDDLNDGQASGSSWRDTRVGGMRAPGDDPREAGLRAAGFGPAKLSPDEPAKIEEPTVLGQLFGMKPRAFNEYGDEIPYQGGDPGQDGGQGGLQRPSGGGLSGWGR